MDEPSEQQHRLIAVGHRDRSGYDPAEYFVIRQCAPSEQGRDKKEARQPLYDEAALRLAVGRQVDDVKERQEAQRQIKDEQNSCKWPLIIL